MKFDSPLVFIEPLQWIVGWVLAIGISVLSFAMIARLRRHIHEESVGRPIRLMLWVPLVFAALPSLLALIMLLDLLTALVWLCAPAMVSQQVLELWLATEVVLSTHAIRIAPVALGVLALHESVRSFRRRLRTDAASDASD